MSVRHAGTTERPAAQTRERRVIWVVAAVQFINIVDFMMVMPLGGDLVGGLGIASAQMGLVAGAYSVSACVAGLLGALLLDRLARRRALALAIGGLAIGTMLGAAAFDLTSLVGARLAAGFFGGPATALALATVADQIPDIRRGRAMGQVAGAFAAASVIGVPVGLELAKLGGFRVPFLVVGGIAAVIAVLAGRLLPDDLPQPRHGRRRLPRLRPEMALAFAAVACALIQGYAIMPIFAVYLQFNLGFPRDQLGLLYLIGGSCSFVFMRLTGRLVDRFGTAPVSGMVTAGIIGTLLLAFGVQPVPIPVLLLFPLMMVVMTARNVASQALMSKVPGPDERGGFMSLASAVQHMAGFVGASLSSLLLGTAPSGALTGTGQLLVVAIAFAAVVPVLQLVLERRLRRNRIRGHG